VEQTQALCHLHLQLVSGVQMLDSGTRCVVVLDSLHKRLELLMQSQRSIRLLGQLQHSDLLHRGFRYITGIIILSAKGASALICAISNDVQHVPAL
jgi:hypothetical protein